jgi:tetratricopeptide (TPR) repeat protein
LDWAAFWTATLVTFAVYFFTLGPSVGLEDSGELATAAAHLGVPHPPGYPFWTLCSWIFCKLFFWVTYMGHPTPAWSVSLCSAFFGAFAAGFTAMLICRSARDFVDVEADDAAFKPSSLISFGGGVGGALTFAFSPVEWSQSTIVEVYSLNAFFLMWVFLLSYRWMRGPSDKILWLTAFVFGLGLTNYQVLLFAVVPLAIIIAMKNAGLFRDVFIYLIPVGLTYQVLKIGCMLRADANMQADVINKHLPVLKTSSCPSSTLIAVALSVLVISIMVASFKRARGGYQLSRRIVLFGGITSAVLIFLSATLFATAHEWVGVSVNVAPLIEPQRYAIIAAILALSVVFSIAAAMGADDEKVYLGENLKFISLAAGAAVIAIIVAAMTPQAGDLGYVGDKYPWGKSTFIFFSLIAALFVLSSFTKKGLCLAVPAAGLQITVFLLLTRGAMNGLTHPQSWWFAWPIVWNFILLAMSWVALPNGRSVAGAAFFAQLGVSFYAYMPIVSDLRNPPMNWGYPRTWEGFKHAIMRGQYEAIGIQSFDSVLHFLKFTGKQMTHYFSDVLLQFTDILVVLATVPFVAARWLVSKAHRKTFWQWMIAALACFLMMSFLLILLANVKGDLQDGFIQKVKFISSHAMIAMWIGYGLVFVGAFILKFVKVKNIALILAAAMILVSGVTPIVQNYTNDQLVFEMGGSEQNGHTFGWQFGAYQLEGANAINAQIVADEEPLPDPTYPPPMEKSAIFFGGTDPGRFVPTYMIYAANFRPDVYLITQNALADDTYMSVERDLYGDEIWIPSKEDSAEAFNIYVDEVQRGIRPANGDLRIENGRVQVTGALGVMEINAILTKMMHDHDKKRHAFYVEESYVISWMYPYLSPHGLIMKINSDVTPYDKKTAQKDADFWDWYMRRLLDDPMYRRDFAGQKSFSKLRAAIAGLYIKQGRYREGSQAFREACILYPASPEATFRYAQECLLPFSKWNVALDLMDYTDAIDPRNRRTENMRAYVIRIRELTERISGLERKKAMGSLTKEETMALAGAYFEVGRAGQAAQLARGVVDKVDDLRMLRLIASIFIGAGYDADAEVTLQRYLKMNPAQDAFAWADLAKLQHRAGKREAAQKSFIQGYSIDRNGLYQQLRRDKELQEIALPLFQRAR